MYRSALPLSGDESANGLLKILRDRSRGVNWTDCRSSTTEQPLPPDSPTVSHDRSPAGLLAGRVWVLREGRILHASAQQLQPRTSTVTHVTIRDRDAIVTVGSTGSRHRAQPGWALSNASDKSSSPAVVPPDDEEAPIIRPGFSPC